MGLSALRCPGPGSDGQHRPGTEIRRGISESERQSHSYGAGLREDPPPDKDETEILMDLIGSTPGAEGKWFATAKDLKLYDLAVKLANLSPCDPRTLNRAARDHMVMNPGFTLESAVAAIRWLAEGWGYEITALDIRTAFTYAMDAAGVLGREKETLGRLMALLEGDGPSAVFVRQAISPLLSKQ